jgi:L-threonylcarbamoyladenylate synthase
MTGSNPQRHGQNHGPILTASALAIAQAAAQLRDGAIVAVPTETVYGLAANAANANAVAAIYRAKGRPDFNPLIVHVPDRKAAGQIAEFNALADKLAAAFWPGPLTLVLPLREDADITKAVTAGLTSIAIRCPAHPVMQALLLASGLNLAAPSANRSGGISPTRADHVAASLGNAVPLIIDGGACRAGIESTIVAMRKDGWELLRPGPITADDIAAIAGTKSLDSRDRRIEAPGQLASHYAPSKPVQLEVQHAQADDWLIGFGDMTCDDNLSASSDLAEAAARLYDVLHRADQSERQRIAVAPIPNTGIGVAINDRLHRAAVR